MIVSIGYDYVGYEMKDKLIDYMRAQGHTVLDLGPDSAAPCFYADYGEKVARSIVRGESERGVLICGTGVGISLAANKVHGIRAAVCSEPVTAALCRHHNDAQIIAFGARIVGLEMAKAIIDAFLNADFDGGRHAPRIERIMDIERRETEG